MIGALQSDIKLARIQNLYRSLAIKLPNDEDYDDALEELGNLGEPYPRTTCFYCYDSALSPDHKCWEYNRAMDEKVPFKYGLTLSDIPYPVPSDMPSRCDVLTAGLGKYMEVLDRLITERIGMGGTMIDLGNRSEVKLLKFRRFNKIPDPPPHAVEALNFLHSPL